MAILLEMEKEGLSIKLPEDSLIMLGGGWKQFSNAEVEKNVVYRLAEKLLGIGQHQIQEFFGVVEHSSPYFSCGHGHFHVPSYSRVLIRDPVTLDALPYGKPGLLNLISPLIYGMPLLSIMTDDIAVLNHGEDCGCGIKTPYFQLMGRAYSSDIKTCAVGVMEILEELV